MAHSSKFNSSLEKCLFCLGTAVVPQEEKDSSFLGAWANVVGEPFLIDVLQNDAVLLQTCGSCHSIVEEFCEVYVKWKELERQLTGRMERLSRKIQETRSRVNTYDRTHRLRDIILKKSQKKLEASSHETHGDCLFQTEAVEVKEEYNTLWIPVDEAPTSSSSRPNVQTSHFIPDDEDLSEEEIKPNIGPLLDTRNSGDPLNETTVVKTEVASECSENEMDDPDFIFEGDDDEDEDEDDGGALVTSEKNQAKAALAQYHKARAGSGKRIRCLISDCRQYFWSQDQLHIHQTHHGEFPCQFCETGTTYAPDLALHEGDVHADKTPKFTKQNRLMHFYCSRCPYACVSQQPFVRHFLQSHLHLEINAVVCPICNLKMQPGSSIRMHLNENHNIEGLAEEEIFRCAQCPAYFTRVVTLNHHQIKVHAQANSCGTCGQTFSSSQALRLHVKRKHPELNPDINLPFACRVEGCSRRFLLQTRLEKHQEICEMKHQKEKLLMDKAKAIGGDAAFFSWSCPECSQTFEEEAALKNHIRLYHIEQVYYCDVCNKAFHSKSILRTHKKYHLPKDQWPFGCDECDMRFVTQNEMKKHRVVHTKDKPYKCQYCGKQFAYPYYWKHHVKTVHPGLEA